ncbi:hypothetical protein CTAYLR_006760 [Chrysophaeum taylorii]|uniref:Helicase ATP-binding domain-containing protein n=1 Tax=Chrysophaeum taylorii TaxID=2483200 RepID=A0AAD7UDV9_9STRA|nr:hypothetical protein CTAYLR_006760 [Chrysophaeum taylorii]
MSAVLRALRERRDAILESPTGTGKTLCLLAAALSFAKPRNLKVVYASRTHAQLGQAIGQLGLIGRFKVAWLAGRDKLCNVPEVRSLKGEAQAKACKAAKCPKPRAYARATDIEDLAKAYAAKGACGFFAARAQATGAEIAFAPHALMDGFKSAILIVDEAHHITGEVPDAYCRLFASGTMVGVSPKLRRNPLRLENDHCISPSQLEALIVPTIEGRDLKFTKAHRPMDDVTYIISTLPRRSVVFFPSYEFLDQALKLVPFAAVDQKNWTHLLFGVCRGKLAEGIDLKCDCVMITRCARLTRLSDASFATKVISGFWFSQTFGIGPTTSHYFRSGCATLDLPRLTRRT